MQWVIARPPSGPRARVRALLRAEGATSPQALRFFHSLALTKIDRRAVGSKLASVEPKSGPVESNRTRASLSAFYTWCISEGYAETNPVTGTNRRGEKSA